MNNRSLLTIVCGILAAWSMPAYGWIKPEQAKNHIGQKREVCGYVDQVKVKPYGAFINMTQSVRLKSGLWVKVPLFTVVYWVSDWENVGVTDPEGYFDNSNYCFTGVIDSHPTSRYKPGYRIPQTRLTDHSQYRLFQPEKKDD